MSPGAIAVGVIAGIVGFGATLGFLAGARRNMDLEQWTTAGRGFGPLLMYLLMAGEVYTTFSFLGAGGWAYSRGGPTLYILAYLTLAYVVSFFLLPPLWELGRSHGLQTQSDFFTARYGSLYLSAFVCLVGVVFLIPYLQLQLTGLGIIVSVASFGAIGQPAAIAVCVVLVIAFVLTGGVRAVAWVSVLKDILMVVAAVAVGVGIPYIHFGGIGPMFRALVRQHPAHLTMPGATANLGHTWFMSTVLLTAAGFYMWPHAFAATFTAKSADTLRRNAVVMPLYTLTLAFTFIAGFTAVLAAPGLANGDLSLLTVARQSFPPWFLGVIGGAGALTAMAPASIFLLSAATLVAKNLVRPLLRPAMTDAEVGRMARVIVVVLGAIALYLAIFSSSTLVSLLLLGYAGVTQSFPGVVLGIFWKRASMAGVFSGMLCGVALVIALFVLKLDPFHGWNAGFLALCVNFAVTVLVSRQTVGPPYCATRPRADSRRPDAGTNSPALPRPHGGMPL